MGNELVKIGKCCQDFRLDNGYGQIDVAHDTFYTVATVSAFECGRDNNLLLFLWYISKGLNPNKISMEIYKND